MQFHVIWIFYLLLADLHLEARRSRGKTKNPQTPPPPQTKTLTITRRQPPNFVVTNRNSSNRIGSSSPTVALSVNPSVIQSTIHRTSSNSSSSTSFLSSNQIALSGQIISSTTSRSSSISETRSRTSSISLANRILASTNISSLASSASATSSSVSKTMSSRTTASSLSLSSSFIALFDGSSSSSSSGQCINLTLMTTATATKTSTATATLISMATSTATATVTVTEAISICQNSPLSSSLQPDSSAAIAEVVPLGRVPIIAEQIENLSNVIGRLNAILGRLIGGDDTTTTTTPHSAALSISESVNSVARPIIYRHPAESQLVDNETSTTAATATTSSSSSLISTRSSTISSETGTTSFHKPALIAAASLVPTLMPTSLAVLPKEAEVVQDVDLREKLPEFCGPNKSWNHFSLDNLVADDGFLTYEKSTGGTAVLDTNPFKKFVGPHKIPELDNIKFEAYFDAPVELNVNKTTCFEWLAQAEIFGAENSPYPANYTQGSTDLRLAAASFSLYDPETDHSFQFLLTNDRVYAIYERLSINRGGALGNYAVYTFAQPVAARNITTWHALKIAMETPTKQISWHVNGIEVFRVTKVGRHILGIFPIINMGGYEVDSYPERVTFGFGAQTLLNAYKPNNHVTPPPPCYHKIVRDALVNNAAPDSKIVQIDPVKTSRIKPASFFDPDGTDPKFRVWGQGCISKVKQIRVYNI